MNEIKNVIWWRGDGKWFQGDPLVLVIRNLSCQGLKNLKLDILA